jgi:hypothetical protein
MKTSKNDFIRLNDREKAKVHLIQTYQFNNQGLSVEAQRAG